MVSRSHPVAASSWAALRRWLPLAALAVLAAVAFALGWHRVLSLEALARNYDALRAIVAEHRALALLGYAGVYVGATALSLPGGVLLTTTGGLLFGWLAGGLVAIVSATVGATALFLIARSSIGAALRERAGPSLSRFAEGFRADAWSYLLFLRLVPVFPFWLVNLAPALLGVPLRVFVVTTLLGIVPATFAFAFVGASVGGILEAASHRCAAEGCPSLSLTELVKDVVEPKLLVLALVGLGILALVPPLARRLRGAARGRSDG